MTDYAIGAAPGGNITTANVTDNTDIPCSEGGTGYDLSMSVLKEYLSEQGVILPITKPDLTGNSYTIAATDYTVLINDDDADVSGTVVVALPAAASNTGRVVQVKKIGSSQTVQLDGNGAETIDGAATVDIAVQYNSLTVQCDGTEWHII